LSNVSFDDFVLACESQRLSEFSSFGWRFLTTSSSFSTIPTGLYFMQIYWSANQNWTYIHSASDSYQLSPMSSILMSISNGSYQAVRIDKKSFNRGSDESVTVDTSFNFSTNLYAYFVECMKINGTDMSNCTSYESNGTNFTYSEAKQKATIPVPDSLKESAEYTNLVTYLHFYAKNCDGSRINTTYQVNITKSSHHSSSSLPPGAIVGIVCAGVLVLGLAAWWLCMRKPGGDNYKRIDD